VNHEEERLETASEGFLRANWGRRFWTFGFRHFFVLRISCFEFGKLFGLSPLRRNDHSEAPGLYALGGKSIVSKLEGGDLDLEESIKLFEEGIRLSNSCSQKLDEAEKKIEILLRNKEGVLEPQPFGAEEEGKEENL
jgi:exodeoxyribonuclease VII small subunit